MKIIGIAWLGTRTGNFQQMVDFCQNILGLPQTSSEHEFSTFDMPNGDRFELFGDGLPFNTFMTHPVAGFLVDDIVSARAEMEEKGIEFLGPIEGDTDDYKWTNFRAPDGFIYELTYFPGHPSNRK